MTSMRPGDPAARGRPAFEVKTGGTALDPLVAAAVVEVDVHEEVGRHGRLSVLLQNKDSDRRQLRYTDKGPFTPGAAITVAFGYDSTLSTVFDGVVVSITAHFTAGKTMLRVEGRSRSVLLDHPPRSRQLADVTDADIASAIAADYALTTDADDGVAHDFWVSDRMTDWQALTRRAAELGWVVYVRGATLVLRPPAAQSHPIALDVTHDPVVELHLTQDLTHAVDAAVGVAWDLDTLEAAESEEAAGAAGLDAGGRPRHDAAVGDAAWPLRTARLESPAVSGSDEADLRAIGAQRIAALAHVHGKGVIVGDPHLRCDSWVSIADAGERLSGPHYVTAARHRLSTRGYHTEFQIGMPPRLTPPETADAAHAGAAALVLGVVESLDDPLRQNRVRVRLPWRADSGAGVWARIACIDAGDGFGAVIVPSAGQEVLVGFVDGDPAVPVVLGSMYNGAQRPPLTVDPDTNAVRALVSPAGHTVRLEDGAASAVTLASGAGHSLVLDDKESAVVLTHEGSGNAIRLSGNGIEFVAARGDIRLTSSAGTISLDALKLEATASGPSKIESSATFDLKAAGSLGLKGALITIN